MSDEVGAAQSWVVDDAAVAAAVRRVHPTIAGAVPLQAADQAVTAALADYHRDHPDAPGPDALMLTRIAIVALDPSGAAWQEAAGLLDTDSCGYPVAGGLNDVRSDLAASPLAAGNPQASDAVLARLRAEWLADYLATGSADLARPWQQYLSEVAEPAQG